MNDIYILLVQLENKIVLNFIHLEITIYLVTKGRWGSGRIDYILDTILNLIWTQDMSCNRGVVNVNILISAPYLSYF